MPQFAQIKEDVKRFYLPSTKKLPQADQAWVDLDVSPVLTQDLLSMDDSEGKVKMGATLLAHRIKGWNFTEGEGEAATPVAVTVDSVCRLELVDFSYLSNQINGDLEGLTKDQKKA